MTAIIIGAGGHGKVVLEILRARPKLRIAGFIDADESLAGRLVAGVQVIGDASHLPRLRRRGISNAIVAIGDNNARMQYMDELASAQFELINAIHPRAIVSKSARLGENVVIAAGAVVCTEAEIRPGAIVNSAAVVEHECVVGACAHIGPTAALAGRVRVGTGAFVGMGAKVIQCLTIGDWSTVGAGAVVLHDVPPGATVAGVPARDLKAPDSGA